MAFPNRMHTETHNNGTENLTFAEKTQYGTHETQNVNPKPKNVKKNDHYDHAYVTLMAVLIIFSVFLQTAISFKTLSIGVQGKL